MGKCKTIAIQTDFRIFSHNRAYSGIIQACVALKSLEPCVTLGYLEPWYIQNIDIFRTRIIFRSVAYLRPCYIQNPGRVGTFFNKL